MCSSCTHRARNPLPLEAAAGGGEVEAFRLADTLAVYKDLVTFLDIRITVLLR